MLEKLWALISSDAGQTALLSLAVMLIGHLLVYYFRPTSRVVWSSPHRFTFLMPGGDQRPEGHTVHTQMIWVQNMGRAAAEDLQLVLDFKPQHYEIFPTRSYDDEINPDGRLVIKVPNLGIREFFTVQLISVGGQLPELMNLVTKDGQARQINMGPMQIFSPRAMFAFGFVFYTGVLALIYLAISALAWLAG